MPIFDARDYSEENTSYISKVLQDISDEPSFFEENMIFYFNIYLGDKFFISPDGVSPFHVFRNMEFGYLIAVFHSVARSAVFDRIDSFQENIDDCITLVWTAREFDESQVHLAIQFADEIARNIELATGAPLPIGLGDAQRPTNFEVAYANIGEEKKGRISLRDERSKIPRLSTNGLAVVDALMGFNASYEKWMEKNPVSSIAVAARWQQKAIRALGSAEYADCIICCAVWAEIFLVQVTVNLMILNGEPINDLRSEVSRGLPQFLNRFLGSKFLKGNWDHTSANTEIGEWYSSCYELRSRVAHEGHIPSSDDARKVYDITHKFVRSISKQLGELRQKELEPISSFFREMTLSKEDSS